MLRLGVPVWCQVGNTWHDMADNHVSCACSSEVLSGRGETLSLPWSQTLRKEGEPFILPVEGEMG